MKIEIHYIHCGTGSDVYFINLFNTLKNRNMNVTLHKHHHVFQYVPYVLRIAGYGRAADVVHTNIEYAWIFAYTTNKIISSIFHNVFDLTYFHRCTVLQKFYYSNFLRSQIRKSLLISSKIIAISQYTKKSFINSFPNKKTIYIQPIDEPLSPIKYKENSIKSSSVRLLFVGSNSHRKGFHLLSSIMKSLGERYVLYFTAKRHLYYGLPKNMIPVVVSTRDELLELYKKSDGMLCPSMFEGYGYQLRDAMKFGLAIFTFNNSAIGETLHGYKNAYLSQDNNIEQLIQSIRKCSFRKISSTQMSKTSIDPYISLYKNL